MKSNQRIFHLFICAMMVAWVCVTVGCHSSPMTFTAVELRGVRYNATIEEPLLLSYDERVLITDPHSVQKLASFFPGLGSGRKAWCAFFSSPDMEYTFYDQNGRKILAYTKMAYQYWGSILDDGDLNVRGNLKAYLPELLKTVPHTHPAISFDLVQQYIDQELFQRLLYQFRTASNPTDRTAAFLALVSPKCLGRHKLSLPMHVASVVIANNMVNEKTTAYKTLRPSLVVPTPPLTKPVKLLLTRDFSQGHAIPTGRTLDICIKGDWFFTVCNPKTKTLSYTRLGSFFINYDGALTVGDYQLYPPINFPSKASDINITADGRVFYQLPGQTTPLETGSISLTCFPNPQALHTPDGIYFTPTPAAGQPTIARPEYFGDALEQGFLEASNVDPATEIVAYLTLQGWLENPRPTTVPKSSVRPHF